MNKIEDYGLKAGVLFLTLEFRFVKSIFISQLKLDQSVMFFLKTCSGIMFYQLSDYIPA
jgi:hypothetical protein